MTLRNGRKINKAKSKNNKWAKSVILCVMCSKYCIVSVAAVYHLGFGEYSGISEDIILVGGMLPCLSTY